MSCVLLVDGDKLGLLAMKRALCSARYTVLCAESGERALLTFAESVPDVAIIDLILPDMLGSDLIRAIRQKCDANVRCVLISRFGHDDERAAAMDGGAFDCIDQPISRTLLVTIVGTAISVPASDTRVDPEESHALARWADVVVRGVDAPRDMRTLRDWGRSVAASPGAIRNWCYSARVPARDSLLFTRVLRAVFLHNSRPSKKPEDLLNIVDRRTLTKVLKRAGGTESTLPSCIDDFLDRQQILPNVRAMAVVRAAIGSTPATRSVLSPREVKSASATGSTPTRVAADLVWETDRAPSLDTSMPKVIANPSGAASS
jgi:CheY-like chemotaxis protein